MTDFSSVTSTVDTAAPFSIYVGESSTTYRIEIDTSAGNTYEGWLTID